MYHNNEKISDQKNNYDEKIDFFLKRGYSSIRALPLSLVKLELDIIVKQTVIIK